jgi:hypothetical protein
VEEQEPLVAVSVTFVTPILKVEPDPVPEPVPIVTPEKLYEKVPTDVVAT